MQATMRRRSRSLANDRETVTNLRHLDWHAKYAGGRGWPMSLIAAVFGVTDEAVRQGIRRVNLVREVVEDAAIP